MTDMHTPSSEQKPKRPKLHPVRMQKIPAHLNGAAELEKLCFSAPWSATSLELLTNDGIGVGYVLTAPAAPEAEPAVVAYGGMLITVDEGQITNIAVREDCRQRGLGYAVMQELEREARARGLVQLSLEVRVSNLPALSLYESQGFRTVGCRRNFYSHPKEDALVMIKTL